MKWIFIFLLSLSVNATAAEDIKYFPAGKLEPTSTVKDNYKTKRYAKFLSAMQEPSLWEMSKTTKNEIYRFLLLRFSDDPVCVRVEISESGDVAVYKKTTSGRGGAQPGDLKINETKNVSISDVQALLAQINNAKFWDLKIEEFSSYKLSVTDSSKWIFEGVKDGNYQLIEIATPQEGTADDVILSMGKSFLSTAGMEVEKLY